MRRLFPALAALAALTAPVAQADPALAQRVVSRFEATAAGCTDARPGTPETLAMATAIDRFRRAVPEADAVPIELRECYWDGLVLAGERIVVSTRLARATPAQRFFVIAHEFGHVAARHHDGFVQRTLALLADGGGEPAVLPALAPLSRRHEFEADAFAAVLMRRSGLAPEEAARFLEAADRGQPASAGDTHPTPGARAAALRAQAAARTAE